MYGQTDDIIEAREACEEAVRLLLGVAKEEQTVADVRRWLEENYPALCYEEKKEKKKKW